MFNLFGKKNQEIQVIDKIWMSEKAKWDGLVGEWKKDQAIIIAAWFETTLRHLETLFAQETNSSGSLFMVQELHSSQISDRQILFAEHYPLHRKEQETYAHLNLKQAIVHSAMDEALFKHFGGDKIAGMMKQMGMAADSVVEHKLISNAIGNAQVKIEKKVISEHLATSQKEWIERNL